MAELKHVTIHSDGVCEGNPSPGGWAAVLEFGNARKEISGGELATTNNRQSTMRICTIGFTHKNAEDFFTRLKKSGVKRVVDVRLNNVSQLAGFSKRDDLKYFLNAILGIEYVHLPILAPTQDIFDEFKKKKGDWKVFEQKFVRLIKDRRIEKQVPREIIDEGCLLCSEDKPPHCHRRLVAEYLRGKWGNLKIEHL